MRHLRKGRDARRRRQLRAAVRNLTRAFAVVAYCKSWESSDFSLAG